MDKVIVGGSGCLFIFDIWGIIFVDIVSKIINSEFGFYVGLECKFLDDCFIFLVIVWVDKNQNFDWISIFVVLVVWKFIENNYFCLLFFLVIWNLILFDQYFWLDVGFVIFVGSVNGFDSFLIVELFEDFVLNFDEEKFNYFNVDFIWLEWVRIIEAGYCLILGENFYVDVSYYYNIYNDFIGFWVGLDVEFIELNLFLDVQVYWVLVNVEDQVIMQGFVIGLNYYFKKFY